jgi:mannosyltransferase
VATHALQRRALPRTAALATSPLGGVALFALLLGISLFVRTRALGGTFWIDEGLSVGIASFPLVEIPGVLRQDGSPPLYYLLLHVWIDVFGSSEVATHALSLLFALLTIPAALWAGWTLFGRSAGWIAAALAALNPFLTIYAQETRMYALVILLSVVGTAAFVHGFVHRRRRYVALFATVLLVMVYTHYWSLFFAAGALAALVVVAREATDRRAVVLDGGLAFGAVVVLFAPWLPTLVYQARHTGAPWSETPSPLELVGGVTAVLSGQGTLVALLFGAGIGVATVIQRPPSRERSALLATLVLAAVTLLSGWLYSQVTPAWSNRYLAVLVGPLLLVAAGGVARAGRLGLVAFVLVLLFWVGFRAEEQKSNARDVAARFGPTLERGDLLVSTQPEQVPVLAYYFGDEVAYASPLGPFPDTRVMDWRDVVPKLAAARPETTLEPLLDEVPVGRQVLLVRPLIRNPNAWEAEWTSLVHARTRQWTRVLRRDERFVRTAVVAPPYTEHVPRGIRVEFFTKTRSG